LPRPDGSQSLPPRAAGSVPVVTALRKSGRDRVAVELDGVPWRVLPLEPVLAAGLGTGVALDRARARELRRELRRVDALRAGLTALRYTDHTAATLRRRLAARGVAPAQRDAAIGTLSRAGLVDDARFAQGRSAALAARGAGNELIRADLESRGVPAEVTADAIALLEPEPERLRRILAAEGRSARVLRKLVAKGFSDDVLEGLIAD
jgi:SOS response regulatory protein OraA/RecX